MAWIIVKLFCCPHCCAQPAMGKRQRQRKREGEREKEREKR
jgi:hypothetical protein